MGAESYHLFFSVNNTEIKPGNMNALNGKKVGVNKNSIQEAMFADFIRQRDINAQIVELTESHNACHEMLEHGEIDAFLTLDAFGESGVTVPVMKIGQSDFYFAVNKDRQDLIDELDDAMGRIIDEDWAYNQKLYERFIRSKGTSVFLPKDEQMWIVQHGPIRVGYQDNYLPFCDADDEKGELAGVLKEYLKLAEDCMQNTHIRFTPVPYQSINAALDALKAGEIDCVFPVNLSSYDSEQLGVSVSTPIMETEIYAAIRRSDHNMADISSDQVTVAILEHDINYEIFLKDNFPDWKVIYCTNTEDCMRAVADRRADCMLFSNYRMTETHTLLEKYKLTHIPTGKPMSFSFAVPETEGELYYVLDKTAGLVSQHSVDSALLSYSMMQEPFSFSEFIKDNLHWVILIIFVVAGIIVLLLLRRGHRIKKQLEERMKLQKALSDALTEAEKANKAKTTFLSNMSHEIRTPMNTIIGLDTIALRDESISQHTREVLEKIGASARHLLALINDILDMSRIESGRMVLKEEEFSFCELLDQIKVIVGGQCEDKGLIFNCLTTGKIDDYFIGDDLRLKQVIINILGNSVKFTNAPGEVTFSAEQYAEENERVSLRIRMEDTGIGMDEEFIPRLFEAFSQENGGTVTKYGGSGLGMSITKNIVEMMGGTIQVESRKGVGTKFTVTVTLGKSHRTAEKAPETREAQKEEAFTLKGRHILIAEDQKINADILSKILQFEGMTSEWAENGKRAVEIFEKSEKGHFDAILMDMRMPVMDGLEATREIRKTEHPDASSIPIIALTANAFEDDIKQCISSGMNAHHSKPVNMPALKETMIKLISEKNK